MPRRSGMIIMVSLSAGVLPERAAPGEVRRFGGERAESSRPHTAVLASWLRSRDLKLDTDKTVMKYVGEPDLDIPLTRSAEQVLRRLCQQSDGLPVSIVLTDPAGLVLSRLTSDADFERELGQERYADNVEDLACAGVPIRHPISGRTIGAVDLTCWRKDAGALLPTLARTAAEQIRQALLAESGLDELELFQAYRGTCRRMRGIVFALTSDAVILNDYARTVLDPADQVALLAEAAEALTTRRRGSTVVDLPTGVAARLYCRLVRNGGSIVGVVAHVRLTDAENQQTSGREAAPAPLPGLVGSAPLWLRACHEVEEVVQSGEWLAISGEPGVGKMALLRTVLLHEQPGRQFVIFDAADAASDGHWLSSVRQLLTDTRDSVVVRHVQVLNGPRLRALSYALQHANSSERDPPRWVAVTLTHALDNPYVAPLLRLFPNTVEVPPLRLHLEDLQELVSSFLARFDHGGQLTCSREAMRILMRASWPGNVEQVHQMLGQVVQHRRAGVIQPSDLPPEALTISRRLLSPLESLTRDAIVTSLADAHGNKVKAARSLGISRATIYRKIHEYGIVPPTP
ncbi:MAG: sigma-54 dependent transcriptional regulator, acetoin dehydrogenase operon transcriptional [Pseudonocardiales bacterium]|nr:sigma-54 dependent transcriptional regulator, acetoin dehydrogenase operon transcriptional [Pseudonocardiales bacterium]